MTSCPLEMIPSSIASSSLNDQYGLKSTLYGECFDVVWPSMHYGLHQAVQHGVSLGGFTQLVLFLGCEADEVVLTEANLVLGEVEAVYTEVEVKGCLVCLGWKSG